MFIDHFHCYYLLLPEHEFEDFSSHCTLARAEMVEVSDGFHSFPPKYIWTIEYLVGVSIHRPLEVLQPEKKTTTTNTILNT